ncbi:MAG: hypothetical protein AB1792_11215 [Candidatus Zixiibacteriota bacterium]
MPRRSAIGLVLESTILSMILIVWPASPVLSQPPPLPPGLDIARTAWDMQHRFAMGYQVAHNPGTDYVHFLWTGWSQVPASLYDDDRGVYYNCYQISTAFLTEAYGGVPVVVYPGVSRSGFVDCDLGDDDQLQATLHQRQDYVPYTSWRLWFPFPGTALHIDTELGPSTTAWPRIAVQQKQPDDIVHILATDCAPEEFFGPESDHLPTPVPCAAPMLYWRYDGTAWQGPVTMENQTLSPAYLLTSDRGSDKVAFVFVSNLEPGMNGMANVVYYESPTAGAGWISGAELDPAFRHVITNYNVAGGPQAGMDIAAAYDNAGNLHIVWAEQRVPTKSQVAIRHWSTATASIRPVAFGYWDNPVSNGNSIFDLNFAKLTLGVGDGGTICAGTPNTDYLYLVFTQFGGFTAAELADYSAGGYMNGELYLTVSPWGGLGWSVPANLTNTQTPGCDPGAVPPGGNDPPRPDDVCRSEHWASIGQDVHDIDILFVVDQDAGVVAQGEGTWQWNYMMYQRHPGGVADAPYVCPLIAPQIGTVFPTTDPPNTFHVLPGDVLTGESFSVANLGLSELDGEVTVTMGARG